VIRDRGPRNYSPFVRQYTFDVDRKEIRIYELIVSTAAAAASLGQVIRKARVSGSARWRCYGLAERGQGIAICDRERRAAITELYGLRECRICR